MSKYSFYNKKIQRNYFLVTLILGVTVFLIIGQAFTTAIIEKEIWTKVGRRYDPYLDTIPPIRGKIYSSDGRLMAVSEVYYQLFIDYWANGLKEENLRANSQALSIELNKMFPEKSANQYDKEILNGYKMRQREAERIANGENVKKNRSYPLPIRPVDYLEYEKIKKFPFFNQGSNKSGLYYRELTRRVKPFGLLASRTIGDIGNRMDTVGGKYGLEKAYNSVLEGKPGTCLKRWVEGRFKDDPEVDAIPGKDIVSTIDMSFQEIAENALMDKLKEVDAESGTAVVMEVKTGEVKAIANLRKSKDGEWSEYLNYALSDMSEPGSTFKVASMMVALDDGVVQPNDPINVGNGKFTYSGTPLFDHNANRGGYGTITAAKAIWYSSNIGIAKIILKGYEKNPSKYVDGLYNIGFSKDLNLEPLEHPDQEKARIRHPKDNPKKWYKTTLPWMSFGYETQIPPIYTLTFFNAIANNGTMIKPIFVKEIRDAKKSEKKKTEIINKRICSAPTLEIVRTMLDSVVNHPNGTGKPAQSKVVRIAGKTGTAQISQGAAGYKAGGEASHQISFCGYFPANEPKYSCIVVIRRPRNGNASGGFMCGPVFKQIAEAIHAWEITTKPIILAKENSSNEAPKVKNGLADQSKYVLNKLDISYKDLLKSKWANTQYVNDRLVLQSHQITNNKVPNVIGMGAKDAVYALENTGLQVNLLGRGEVYTQSLNAGAEVSRGQSITIHLR